jgi:SAM-dependent methyltransferase
MTNAVCSSKYNAIGGVGDGFQACAEEASTVYSDLIGIEMMNVLRALIARFRRRPMAVEEFAGHYVEWRDRRIAAIVEHYGRDFFAGKSVLELGCGFGEIGLRFRDLGARVVFSDGRAEHLETIRAKFPEVETVVADLESEWPFEGRFDLIIHMGVLYHLKNYEHSLRAACANCEHLVLETEVCDSDDPETELFVNEEGYDQALSHVGSRPSAPRVERILDECQMIHSRVRDARCNAGYHTYDWLVGNTMSWRHGQRRLWFCCRKSR